MSGQHRRSPAACIAPGDAAYDEHGGRSTPCSTAGRRRSRCWSRRRRRRGAAPMRARSGLPIGVRGGGHSVAGHGLVDDGLVIDLRRMRGVDVDPAAPDAQRPGRRDVGGVRHRRRRRTAWRSPAGRSSTPAIGGLTLGGGFGFLHGPVRPDLRQPRRGPARDRRRRGTSRSPTDDRPRAPVGAPRRRRQLRDRDPARLPAPPGRPMFGGDCVVALGRRRRAAPLSPTSRSGRPDGSSSIASSTNRVGVRAARSGSDVARSGTQATDPRTGREHHRRRPGPRGAARAD